MLHISSRAARERVLFILLASIIIFGSISAVFLIHIGEVKEEARKPKTIKERVEDIRSFYEQKFKADVTLSAVDMRELHNTRIYKDTTRTGFYVEEQPIFAVDVTVEEMNLNTFRVVVFEDKIVELRK